MQIPNWLRSLLLVLATLAAVPVSAQYFGRNKVQYKHFEYRVLKTEHFDIYYYTDEKRSIDYGARMAERWYARLSKVFDYNLRIRQPILFYADPSDFQQTNAIEGQLGEGTGGVTEVLKRRVVLPFAGSLSQTNHVLGHELVHAFQYDITNLYSGGTGVPTAVRLPLWFIEGMAEYFSIGPIDSHTAMWMRDALVQDDLPTIRELRDTRKYFPYRYGQALLAYIAGRWDEARIGKLLRAAGASGNIEKAIQDVLGLSVEQLEKDWHASIRASYGPIRNATRGAADTFRLVEGSSGNGADLNVGPVLSPDGRKVAFFSTRDLFSIDLFLADVESGKIERKIVSGGLSSHYTSLEFIDSAGAWDPDGRRLAFPAMKNGLAHLVVLDVARDHTEREIPFHDVDQIYGVTWSPDGNRIAFNAMVGGLYDLYIYDLERRDLHRLTQDAYTELQPAWSPDGSRIAFVTDRFDADLGVIAPGPYRLALLDLASDRIEALPGFSGAKHIDPEWSRDGKSLYFLSDPTGITNVYRLDLARGEIFQSTNLYTGASGITGLSPALSAARDADRIVFSVYERGQYKIYASDDTAVLSGQPPKGLGGRISAAVLPPVDRRGDELLALLREPSFGLPDPSTFRDTEYHPHLTFDYVAQPYLVAGADPFGAFAGGGTALYFSDMMGEHNVSALIQVNGGFRDIGGLLGYENRTHRWNWGASVQRVPYVTAGYASGVGEIEGEPVLIEQTSEFRYTTTGTSGVLSYPFSPVHRFEMSGGYSHTSFTEEVDTRIFSLVTGEQVFRNKEKLPTFPGLNELRTSAALVYDSSIFGVTSPILGQRYRLEVTPYVGTIQFYNVLADYRRYFIPVRPYTIAARVLHYGRYGTDAEDERMVPLYLGYPNFVRGYNVESFTTRECIPNETSDCPAYDQLVGTRMLVGNLELRFPLYGAIRHDGSFYGPVPVEGAVFTDVGVAWRAGETPSWFGGSRNSVSSVGGALRVNAFGYGVFELDYVHPFDRPDKGWYWQFNFISGF